MTPDQAKAARGLVGWGIQKIAGRSGTTIILITTYERSGRVAATYGRMMPADPLLAIRTALVSAGVVFNEDSGGGPGVRLHKTAAADAGR